MRRKLRDPAGRGRFRYGQRRAIVPEPVFPHPLLKQQRGMQTVQRQAGPAGKVAVEFALARSTALSSSLTRLWRNKPKLDQ